MEDIINELTELEKWIESCYKRSNLHEFNPLMTVSIEIANHIRELSVLTIGTLTEDEFENAKEGFDLSKAVIIGHLVRIYKLYDQLSFFVANNKGEISSIFSRLLFETFVSLKYLIIKGESSINNYIKVSFKSTIKQYAYIKELESQRELIDIEKRIIRKVDNRLTNVGLNANELINNKDWRLDGLTFRGIIEFLKKNDDSKFNWNLAYNFIFGNMSSSVHGTWYDIEIHHLENKNGEYFPKYSYTKVDPRYILTDSFMPIESCIAFLNWRKTDPDNYIKNVLFKIRDLLGFLNEMDEIRIDKNQKSSISPL
jgi:hypothetical protein